MSDPVQVHLTLENILTVLQETRDNADVYYAQQLTDNVTMNDSLSSINSTMNDLSTYLQGLYTLTQDNHTELMALLNDMNGRVDGINAALDVLNSNSSLNAQNGQNILLGSIGACCDDVTPVTGLPDMMCQKAQQMIASMPTFTQFIADATSGGVLPTVADIQKAFTVLDGDGNPHILISTTDANKLLAALASIGAGSITLVHDVSSDADVNAEIKAILGVAINSAAAYNAIQSIDPDGRSQSAAIVKAYLAFYQPSVISALWSTIPIFTGDGYADDCTEPPPFEGSGYYPKTGDTDSGIGPGNILTTWEMNTTGEHSLHPYGYLAHGEIMTVYCCYNTTVNSDKTVKVWTMDGSLKDTLLATLLPGESATFTVPTEDSWGLEAVDPGDPLTDPTTVVVIFAWSYGDASSNCPS